MEDFEFKEEFIKNNNLTEEQVNAVRSEFSGYYSAKTAELKNQWDGKANENAQRILSGAASHVEKATGIQRASGEKLGDYFSKVGLEYLSSKESEINTLKSDYEAKLKEFKGGDALKSELDKTKNQLDEALKKYADYDSLKENAEKYNPLKERYDTLESEVCYESVRPNFPESVDEYRAKGVFKEWRELIDRDWDVKFEDGKAIAVNKENRYKIEDLKNLLTKDENISSLLKGRQQEGLNSRQVETTKVEGVPFEVPVEARTDSRVRYKVVADYLAKKGIPVTSKEHSKQVSELSKKITQQTA